MSNRKRVFGWLGIPTDSSTSNKRARTPDQKPPIDSPPLGQPSALPSSSNPVAPPNTPTRKNTNAAGYAVLPTLKGSMRILKKVCGAFKPLEQVAEDLLNVLESIENTTKDQPDLLEMASELPQWVLILSSYLSNHDSGFSKNLGTQLAERIAADLNEQVENLKAFNERGTARQWLDPEDKLGELRQCYHRIEASFRQLQTDTTFNTWKTTQDHLQKSQLNEMFPSHNARYDSSFAHKVKRRECLKNTRATVLEDSRRWIYGPGGTKIYWLNGMAGTGKTTIAYTICSELEQNSRLGANFFCSRSASDCQAVNRIFPTIAYQLAQQFYPFRSALCENLSTQPDLAQRGLQTQFTRLIKEPLLQSRGMLPNGVIVVIDALDECLDPGATRFILELLFGAVAQLPIRFLLTSRPEPSILNTIINRDPNSRSVLHLHNVDWQLVNGDIETYLTVSLADVLTPAQIGQLTEQAGVLFIYATTVVRYILSGPAGANRQARLQAVLSKDPHYKATQKDREIDILYMTILDEVFQTDSNPLEQSEIDIIKHILWIASTAREPATKATFAGLLMVGIEDVSVALEPLRSVLNVIEGSEIVSTLHASFPEFILSPERSGQWSCCDDSFVATQCFKIMRSQLHFNICQLDSSFRLDKEVPDLRDRVANTISPGLFYACRYWSEHLGRSSTCSELLSHLNYFLAEQLLFWIEVLNLKGSLRLGVKILETAKEWFFKNPSPKVQSAAWSRRSEAQKILQFIHDASHFVDALAAGPIHWSTPHIYISGLVMARGESELWSIYKARMRGLLWLGGGLIDQRFSQLTGVVKHGCVKCGSNSGLNCEYCTTIDSISQLTLPTSHSPYRSHSTPVASPLQTTLVAFSPDGTRVASGSGDKTICIWSSRDGTPLATPFLGHNGIVTSIAFSPDGTQLVSGSSDQAIRLWKSCDGSPVGSPFLGHKDMVTSVSFSSDGARVVSGSWDRTIRIWNSCDGAPPIDPILGHKDTVASVAFSPDGTRVVSGSWDKTIRVWNPRDGKLAAGPFRGHTGRVTCVAYSPDGTRVVSSSADKTIRIWNPRNGTLLANPFLGHSDTVTSVAFSSDGTRVVSGSWDKTIRVWDPCDSTLAAGPFRGHTGRISCVAYSPDDTRIVSGSADNTIRLWNPGAYHSTPLPASSNSNASVIASALSTPQDVQTGSPSNTRDRSPVCSHTPLSLLKHEPWSVDSDGWIRDSSQNILFWIPESWRDVFTVPPNEITIKGAAFLTRFETLYWGNEWHKCYVSSEIAVPDC